MKNMKKRHGWLFYVELIVISFCMMGKMVAVGKRLELTTNDAIKGTIIMHDKDITLKIFGDLGVFSDYPVPGCPEEYTLQERFIPGIVQIENKTSETMILPVPYIVKEINSAIISTAFLEDIVNKKQTLFTAFLKTMAIMPIMSLVGHTTHLTLKGPNNIDKHVLAGIALINVAMSAAVIFAFKKSWEPFVAQGRLIEKLKTIALEQPNEPKRILPGETYQTTIFIDRYRLDPSALTKDSYKLVYKLWGH